MIAGAGKNFLTLPSGLATGRLRSLPPADVGIVPLDLATEEHLNTKQTDVAGSSGV